MRISATLRVEVLSVPLLLAACLAAGCGGKTDGADAEPPISCAECEKIEAEIIQEAAALGLPTMRTCELWAGEPVPGLVAPGWNSYDTDEDYPELRARCEEMDECQGSCE